MIIFPAIDLLNGAVVMLYQGKYDAASKYNDDPLAAARSFADLGAEALHIVDLEGAKSGGTPHLEIISGIAAETDLFIQVGGGIRSLEKIEKYLNNGIDRVILGTAALTDKDLLKEAIKIYGEQIAVGLDLKDGKAAIRGWTETVNSGAEVFAHLADLGVRTVICTDVSKDGALQGPNLGLYKMLSAQFSAQYGVDIIASGGVTNIDDVAQLRSLDLYGAIIGKACYTGSIDLKTAIEVAK
jgi:phosphoribosylformimino-5-aminoimidazole carboxamide ribotide isomerase